jgi:uncharacterized membrane protein
VDSRTVLTWLHRRSRLVLAAIATMGVIASTHLTVAKLWGTPLACPTNGCEKVLTSPYATLFGIPLSLVGVLAYLGILALAIAPLLASHRQAELRQHLNKLSWRALFVGTTGMAVFSGYMLYVMAAKVQALCIYCLGSAFLSVSLFGITLVGHRWVRIKGLTLIGILIASVVLLGGIGVHANVEQVAQTSSSDAIALEPQGDPSPGVGWQVTTLSGEAERQLARHLKKVGAKEYSAWWCPHCHTQKALFGKDAYTELPNIECDPDGKNAKPQVCDAAQVTGFPTWDIKGKRLVGPQSLEVLSKASGYSGKQNFQHKLPPEQ